MKVQSLIVVQFHLLLLSSFMPELTQAAASEVIYSSNPNSTRIQVWKTLINWLGFIFQLFIQIVKGTPISHLLSVRHSSYLCPTPSLSFKPLPVDEPPPTPSDVSLSKLKIVLDLDETLVCAYETSCLPDVIKNHAIGAGVNCFELECLSSERDPEGNPRVNHVTVFERPGLREFLQKISEFGDLVLFTAGLEGYARPLVDKIDVDKKFVLRLYRPSTVSTEHREHVKDLACISEDLSRTVIVDNNPFSFLLQPVNGIPCVPFSAGQPYDEQLLQVLFPLLKQLSLEKDVRPALYEKFHMPEWFQQHGIPTIP